jgi:hypothetical protein
LNYKTVLNILLLTNGTHRSSQLQLLNLWTNHGAPGTLSVFAYAFGV